MSSILFLTHFYSPHIGGVETHVRRISEELLKLGHTITIVTIQHEPKLTLFEKRDGIIIHRIPSSAHEKKLQTWNWIFTHRHLFIEAEVVHIHDVFWWLIPLLLQIQKKSFITFHGYEGSEGPNWRQRLHHQLASFLTQGNLCIGGFHQKWYGVTPTLTSFGAVDPYSISNQKHKSRTKKIIFLGRLAEDTGIMTYLETIRILHNMHVDILLDIYGDGPLNNVAKKYVDQHKLPVRFRGFVNDARLLLRNYDFAFVSRHLAILEALNVGIPVFAEYNNQIKKDYLEISPFKKWIHISDSAETFAKLIMRENQVSEEARTWASHQTWQKLTNLYLKLWHSHLSVSWSLC